VSSPWWLSGGSRIDGYSAYKEIARDDFVRLIAAIEARELDVVIVRDVDRLTRNLTDWNRFEKACVRHGVLLSPYTGGDLDLSTPEGAYYGGMETLRAKRESAVKSVRVREAKEREARAGKRAGGGSLWFGYVRIYANPDEPVHRKRVILREELHPVNALALRDAAERILRGESVGSIIRDWDARGIRPVAAQEWSRSSLVGTLVSPRIAGLREWHGQKFPTTEWPAIIDTDTHEQLVRLFSDPARRNHVVGRKNHLLSGLAPCPKCGHGLKYRKFPEHRNRADSYACVRGVGGRCGGVAIKAELLEESVTGAVLDALESPRVQEALRTGDQDGRGCAPRPRGRDHRPERLARHPPAHRGPDQCRAP
jgi:site-specific DNA recombinase